jgi:hypothetical protein
MVEQVAVVAVEDQDRYAHLMSRRYHEVQDCSQDHDREDQDCGRILLSAAYFVHSFSEENAQTLNENGDHQHRAAAEEQEEVPVVVPADAGAQERAVVVVA